jgi:hypothetical protein
VVADSLAYRLSILVGRLHAYRGGNLSSADLAAAVRAALAQGVPQYLVDAMLREYGLRWDRDADGLNNSDQT